MSTFLYRQWEFELIFLDGSLTVGRPFSSVALLPGTMPIKVLAHLHKDMVIGKFMSVFFFFFFCNGRKS